MRLRHQTSKMIGVIRGFSEGFSNLRGLVRDPREGNHVTITVLLARSEDFGRVSRGWGSKIPVLYSKECIIAYSVARYRIIMRWSLSHMVYALALYEIRI
jgi:hypothetical protein